MKAVNLLHSSLVAFCICVPRGLAATADDTPRISPRPQVEKHGRERIRFSPQAAPMKIGFANVDPSASPACANGVRLLSRRLERLGAGAAVAEPGGDQATVEVSKVSAETMRRRLRSSGVRENVGGKRLEQAYVLVCRPTYRNRGAIRVTACGELGIYYGFVSLCQLLDKDGVGGISVPAVMVADWPEIGLRLSKASASTSSLEELSDQAMLMPLYKLNVMGLQFHGTNSNETDTFRHNVKAICTRARQSGILETIVYFCPFRGKGYDFNHPADQQRYAELLQWMLDQGADGIEVDYNDWPGRAAPIENVINLACRAVAEKNPQAYVLYCPPSRGTSV